LDQLRRPSSTLYHIDTKPQTIKKHYFHQLAEQLNFYQPSELPATSFNVDESLISKISLEIPKLSSTCFIHPGASSRNKRLPLEFFVKHAEKSASEGLSPCFLLGEAEREQFSSSEIDTLKKYGNLLVNFPLENLAAMFSLCHHYIGNDNGISHLAGCVGADTTIFFHTTDPVLWRPMGPKITVKRLKDEH
jgi:ADP-heptose:LPS heptosyltransferase